MLFLRAAEAATGRGVRIRLAFYGYNAAAVGMMLVVGTSPSQSWYFYVLSDAFSPRLCLATYLKTVVSVQGRTTAQRHTHSPAGDNQYLPQMTADTCRGRMAGLPVAGERLRSAAARAHNADGLRS